MQRACKRCYFQVNVDEQPSKQTSVSATNNNNDDDHKENKNRVLDDDEDDEDDFEDENAALHNIPYYVDNADESFSTEDIFNKFGHGVGSYVLVPADQDRSKSEYYTVTLVVYTQTGFESFNVSLFEKKGSMLFRLESKKLKKKDFGDMNGLIAYIEKKEKLIFSYAIPRSEVEATLNNTRNGGRHSQWDTQTSIVSPTASQHQQIYSSTTSLSGLENYPKAKALFDYEAEVHGDLTLRAGDIIYILDREEEDGWWTGMIQNRQGLFPSTYVEIIEEKPLPSIHKNEPNEGDTLVARYDYEEGGAEELAFNIGDKIVLQAKDESGWWLGKLEKTGVVGWFAPDLVVPLDEQITPAASNTTNGNGNASNGSNKKSAFSTQDNKPSKSNKTKSKTNTVSPKSSPKNGSSSKSKAAPPKGSKKKASPPKGKGSSSATKTKTNTKKPAAPSGSKKKASPPKGPKGSKKSSSSKSSPPKKSNTSAVPSNIGDEPSVCVSYEKLKAKQFNGLDVDKAKLETYLSNKEFFELFKMSRSEFASKPAWKQRTLKKDKGLF
eukprot:CAMPEP_0201572838 /NCGR_PEP_ID=MMETSP0190_2-20130828/16345_1 /ASSEMBLY_ACC=CAM_ASM_000263 /TAXON_ID=37353 /ORGANISM="Rosalina sp." /LENGTH=550 /DNA_ID=CAMNT_0047999105 /DNA_START=1269 /DNA_END=2921 /DNA_ORIENTATION=+